MSRNINSGNTYNINFGDVGATSQTGSCSPAGQQAQQSMQGMDPMSMVAQILGQVANLVRSCKSG